MKLKYKNYIIEDDRNCVRLSEIKIAKVWGNIWEEYESDVVYPVDTQKALYIIFEKEKRRKEDTMELSTYMVAIKELSQELKDFIKLNVK